MALYEETRELQDERNDKFSYIGSSEPIDPLEKLAKKGKLAGFKYNPQLSSAYPEVIPDTPDSYKRRLGSFYDPSVSQENFLAEQQTSAERLGYMIPRIATKAVSEVMQLPGYLGGAVAWGAHGFDKNDIGLLVDNAWQKSIQGIEQDTLDRLPVYTSDAIKSGSLMKNITSTSFWAKEGADGVGFLLAFLVPGAALRFSGYGTKMAKLMKPGTAFAKTLEATGDAAKATQTLADAKLVGNINDISATVLNTLFESAAEGGQTYETILAQTGDTEKAANGAVDVLTKNFGILALSNYIDQKWLFGKSNLIKDYTENKVRKSLANSAFGRVMNPKTGELLDAVTKRTAYEQIGNVSKTVTEGFLKEGFWEEGMQYAAQKRAESIPKDDKSFLAELGDVAKTWVDSLGDTEMQKSIFLGGVLGSGMASFQTVREMKAEDKRLNNFHSLVKDNFIDRYRNISDMAKTDDDGNPIYDENGKIQIDDVKAEEGLSKHLEKYIENKKLVSLADEGNIEQFEELKNRRDMRYFFPFLTMEGGLEAAIKHIDNLAEADVKWMKDERVPIDVDTVKKELKDKVIKYQNIYNRVQSAHDLNMDVKYTDAEKKDFEDFSDLIRRRKIGAETNIQFHADRISKLREELADFKTSDGRTINIASTESKYTPKLVEDLKESFKENKDDLDPTDKINIENGIKNIAAHVMKMEVNKQTLKDAYDKKFLQKEFASYKEWKTKQEATSKLVASEQQKAKDSELVHPNLRATYEAATHYSTDDNNNVVTTSGEVTVTAKDAEGNDRDITFRILGPNNQGNLTVQAVRGEYTDENGKKVVADLSDDQNLHTINSDGTFEYNGEVMPILDMVVSKTGKQVLESTTKETPSKVDQIIPDNEFNNLDSVRDKITKFENDYKHSFSVEAGVDNWLISTGSQVQSVANEDVARWFIFVNNYASRLSKDQSGRKRYIFKTFTFNQVGQLDAKDPIRQNLKFFLGTEGNKPILRTYDEIEDKQNPAVNDDIKIVVYDRDTANVLMVNKDGEIVNKDATYILSNSLPLARKNHLTRPEESRFSFNKAIDAYLRSKKASRDTVTPDQLKEAEDYVAQKFEESLQDYSQFRESLKSTSVYLDITRVNPGVKVLDNAVDTEVLAAAGISNPNELLSRIEAISYTEGPVPFDSNVMRSISGAVHGLVNGFWYLKFDNRFELIKPKTFAETGSVDEIVKLIQYHVSNPKIHEIGNYLHSIIYHGKVDKSGSTSPYAFDFTYDRDDNGKPVGGPKTLIFGANEISTEDLIKGENLEPLKKFLATKYWNFDKNSLKLREFNQYGLNEKGELSTITWEQEDGGYLGFLFGGVNNAPTKGTVYVAPRQKGLNQAINPQYKNQSVSMNRLGPNFKLRAIIKKTGTKRVAEVAEKVVPPVEKKPTTTGRKVGFGKKESTETKSTETKPEGERKVGFGKKSTESKGPEAGTRQVGFKKSPTTPIVEDTQSTIQFEEKPPQPEAKPLGVDEYWESLSEDKKDKFLKATKGNEEAAKKKAHFTYITAQERKSGLRRLITSLNEYEREDLEQTKQWLKEKFPNVPVEIIDGLVDKNAWGKLTKDGKVILSSIAELGTGYHEGFHTFSQLVLAKESRTELYNEVRELLGNDITDLQAEEYLAEEFRLYMLSPHSYNFSQKEQVKKSFFRKLLDLILSIFNISKEEHQMSQIEIAFNVLRTGTFGVTPKEISNEFYDRIKERNRVPGLTDKEVLVAVGDMNATFFDIMFDSRLDYTNSVLFDNTYTFNDLYSDMLFRYMEMAEQAEDELSRAGYEKIVEHFDKLVTEHGRFLKQYQINITNVDDEDMRDEDDIDDKASYTYRDHLNVNLINVIPDQVRFLIAGLPSFVNAARIEALLPTGQVRSTVRFNRIMNVLNDNLANLGTDFAEYAEVLRSLTEYKPELSELLTRLKIDEPVVDEGLFLLRNQFVRSFAHTKNIPILTNYQMDGKMNAFNASHQNLEELVRTKWINQGRARLDDPDSYVARTEDSRETLAIDKQKLISDIAEANRMNDGSRQQLDRYLTILSGIGISVAPKISDVYNFKVVKDYINTLFHTLTSTEGELLLADLFNRDIVKNQKETKALIDYARRLLINDTDLSFYNQDGNKEYTINLNSHTTDTVNLLNKIYVDPDTKEVFYPEGTEVIQPWDGSTGNLFATHSIWRGHLLNGGKLEAVDLKGLIDQKNNRNSARISNATFGDYKAITFNALLNGIVIHLRSADRRRELGFRLTDANGDPIQLNRNITLKAFKDRMSDYLYDELITSFALIVDPANWGGTLNNYSKNAKTLRAFNFLYDRQLNSEDHTNVSSLVDFAKQLNPNDTRSSIEKAKELTNKYLSTYSKYIDGSFTRFINKTNDLTYKALAEDKIIIEKTPAMVFIPGIDTEILASFNIKLTTGLNTINKSELDRMILFANYTQFIGSQEQLKAIMGDMAMWVDTIDFHKRVNGATSPKNKLADGEFTRQNMEELFPRMDGRSRTDAVDIIVVKDIISENKELTYIHKDYARMKGTDAQSWALLDEYRDLMIRNGSWFIPQEKTYQYEMQQLALRLLEAKKAGKKLPFLGMINEEMFTSENGIFFKHTEGKIPTEPMYKGQVIKAEELGNLTIQKPQGFGRIADFKGLYVPQFFKTSTAPVMPSSLSDNNPMFEAMLRMMEAGQGIIAFNTSMKGEVIDSQDLIVDNKTPEEGYVSQKLPYQDFGFQLDISDESKDKVTVSTQRTRLEFLDIFDRGNLVKSPDLQELRDEYVKITNELVEAERNKVINDLGLKWNNDKQEYELQEGSESKQKFKERLIAAFDFSLMPYNIIDGLEFSLDTVDKVFDMTVSKFKIEEIITAMVRKNIISRKTKGDMLIQEADALYDPTLKFYRMENGVVKPMEILIALPTDLIPVVTALGNGNYSEGLARVNAAIAAHDAGKTTDDVKELGEDFFKILDIPMNRIPGQSLSSLDCGHVKAFLPHYHGSKVILPPEITVKAGSDFDVDKMTSYFAYYEVDKEGKVRYFTNMNRPEGKHNRLIEIANKSLLHPERFDELVYPTTSYDVKTLTASVQEKIKKTEVEQEAYESSNKRSNKWENVPTWWYNMQKGYEYFRGKMGTAIAAIHNATNALAQVHPIKMNAYVPLFFEGQVFTTQAYDETGNVVSTIDQSKQYNTGFISDSDNYRISKNFGQFLSAFVDVVKDPFIFDLTDNFTFNTVAFLNRYGVDSSIGLHSIVAFMTQDSIKQYLRIRRANSGKFLSSSQYNAPRIRKNVNRLIGKLKLNVEEQYSEAVANLKANLNGTDTELPFEYKDTVAASLDQLLKVSVEKKAERESILRDIRVKITKYGYRPFSTKELSGTDIRNNFKDQVQILDNFLMYQILGQNLSQLNLQIRPDARSSLSRHLSAIDANYLMPQAAIIEKGLFDLNDLMKTIGNDENKTLITEFYKTQTSMTRMFGWTSIIHKDPLINNFFENKVYTMFADPDKWKSKADVDKAITSVESDFLTFVLADYVQPGDYKDLQSNYQFLFTGKYSVPQTLLKLKKEITNNLAFQELEPSISQRMPRTRILSQTDNINIFNRSLDTHELDVIESDLFDFGYNPNPANQEFMFNLMLHAVFQSGIHNALNSYASIIPNRIFIDLAERAVSQFLNYSNATKIKKLESFYEQFFRNNAENTRIVPRHPWPAKAPKGYAYGFPLTWTDEKNYYKTYNFIAFNYNTHDPRSFVAKGLRVPKGVVLYKKVPGTNVFERVSKQGDGIRMREYYPSLEAHEVEGVSIIDTNRYEQLPVDVPYYEEPEDTSNTLTPADDYMQDEDETGVSPEYDNMSDEGEESDVPPFTFYPQLVGSNVTQFILPKGEESIYSKKLGYKSTVQQALAMIERNSSSPAFAQLATVLKKGLTVPVPMYIKDNYFVKEYGLTSEGVPKAIGDYYSGDHSVNIFKQLNNELFEETVLHEAIHALVQREYDLDPLFRTKLDKIADHAYSYLNSISVNSNTAKDTLLKYSSVLTQDKHEFITYGLTNSHFQAVLSRIPSSNPDSTKAKIEGDSELKNFIQTLIDVLVKYFNQTFGKTDYKDKMNHFVSVSHDLLTLLKDSSVVDFNQELALTGIPPTGPSVNYDTIVNIKKKNQSELSKESTNRPLYNKKEVIKQMLDSIDPTMTEEMSVEFARLPEDEFDSMAKQSGYHKLGKYWTLAPAVNTIDEEFIKFFPTFAYTNNVEKEVLNKGIATGQIEIACGL